jgi:hypothetical protein
MQQDIRYPIGRVEFIEYSDAARSRCVSDIKQRPAFLEATI